MSGLDFYRELRAAGMDEATALRMADQFAAREELRVGAAEARAQALHAEMMERLLASMTGQHVHAAEPARTAAAVRAARYRERQKERESVTESVTNVTESVTRHAGDDKKEPLPHTPSQEKISSPSGDKSPSGDARAPMREAPVEPDLDEDFEAAAPEPPPVVDAEFEDLAQPDRSSGLAEPPRSLALFAEPAAPATSRRRPAAGDTPDFERFWAAYPHKVGKGDARKAFERAIKKIAGPEAPIEVMIRAIQLYVATKPADRAWCNPSTWLNQERWTDEHSAPAGPGPGPRQSEQDRRLSAMVGGAQIALDRFRGRQGGG